MIDAAAVRFALAGLANTAVGYGAILLLQGVVGVGAIAANVGGFLIGSVVSYVLNRNFTFASRRSHAEAFPRFVVAVASCFALNLVVLELALTEFSLAPAIAQAIAVGTYAVAFYVASRRLVFPPENAGKGTHQ